MGHSPRLATGDAVCVMDPGMRVVCGMMPVPAGFGSVIQVTPSPAGLHQPLWGLHHMGHPQHTVGAGSGLEVERGEAPGPWTSPVLLIQPTGHREFDTTGEEK